jgi:hypothetical protein
MGGKLARTDHAEFLAELAANLREAKDRPGVSAEERGRYLRWLDHAASLEGLLGLAQSAQLRRTESQEGLPAALLKELSGRRKDSLEGQILAVLAACGGSADLDQVLIGLYRGYGVIQKRRVIQNKLWRLVRTGRIAKAKDTRNVFSLNTDAERGHRSQRRRRAK